MLPSGLDRTTVRARAIASALEMSMAKFLVTGSYTAEGAKGLRKDGGTKRRRVVVKAVESLGGEMESFYFSFGPQDVVAIVDLPDNAAATALSLAINATGSVRLQTTPLLTPEDMDQASSKKTPYKAPGN
jgi:uncharacterized protein with GYD domain